MDYRVYLLDQQGEIEAAEWFSAADDDEAAAIAADLYDVLSDVCHGYELWQGNRPMSAFRLPVRQSDPEAWAEARQQRMLDLEECLASSYACIRRSRQLLETVDKMLHGQDGPTTLARLCGEPRGSIPA